MYFLYYLQRKKDRSTVFNLSDLVNSYLLGHYIAHVRSQNAQDQFVKYDDAKEILPSTNDELNNSQVYMFKKV